MERIKRRRMLKCCGAASAAFTIVPRHVLGGAAYTVPSDTATRGIIGWGNQARAHPGYHNAQILAIAECDDDRLHDNPPGGATLYRDWREVIARKDIDFVHICTPPHWHGLMMIAAAEAGKDIFAEKPLTHTIGEGLKLVEACRRNGTILRINTWGRTVDGNERGRTAGIHCWDLKKLVDSGLFGTPLTVVMGGQFGHNVAMSQSIGRQDATPESVPSILDYDMWLGPAPYKPYFRHRTHGSFRGYWDYDTGGFGDWAQHWLDPIQFFLGKDDDSPVDIIPADNNPKQHPDAFVPWKRVEMIYRDGTKIIIDDENREEYALSGPDGWLKNNYESNIPDLQQKIAEMPDIEVGNLNFDECMRERKKFPLNEVTGHRSCTLRNLPSIAAQLGRPLKWDPEKWDFVGDEEASRMVWPAMRAPWSLDNPMG
jgi:predicted dehydrogenase